ncbi:dynamin family protein [Dactylosporangium sp. CS-033363]|uniref:dynamin family protein n=1 Tax=Dactylosporangium sp. CS-033363 TaxID=3239935 RepID=UPI003D8AE63D
MNRKPVSAAEAAFARAGAVLDGVPGDEAGHARRILGEVRARLGERLRVALVGRISSGKSTLANALLRAPLAPTGALELTFNVSRFRHAEHPSLTVHFTDGAEPERHDLGHLDRLAARARERDADLRRFLLRIDHLEVGLPNPGLADYDLVDTPGLDSSLQDDSANALRWLGRSGDDITDLSARHASRADALIMVFDRGLAKSDAELLADFTRAGLGGSGPVTTVGALTKVEYYWPEHPDPIAQGRRVADMMMRNAGADRLLFELRPLAGLVAAAAGTFTADDCTDLQALASVRPELLQSRLRLGPAFAGRDLPELPVRRDRRAALLDRFGGWGVWLSTELIRAGCTSAEELRAGLLERSGLTGFRELLLGHFAARAEVIGLDRVVQEVRSLERPMPPAQTPVTPPPHGGAPHDGAPHDGAPHDGAPHDGAAASGQAAGAAGIAAEAASRRAVNRAVAEVTGLAVTVHAFAELTVLRDHYAGRLAFGTAETEELLRVLGERGRTPAERLGLPPDSDPDALRKRALTRIEHWATTELTRVHSGRTRVAAGVIRRAYEVLLDQLRVEENA